MWTPEDGGIDSGALWRYIDEQVYALPGAAAHRDALSLAVVGSRATGTFSEGSDVDLEVLCPQAVYDALARAAREAGVARADRSFFHILRDGDPKRYFGEAAGNPHFSITPLEAVARQFRGCDDVPLWIWTHARVLVDPDGQLRRIIDGFAGYPRDVLVRKIKYRWLRAGYWAIEVGGACLINTVHELARLCFLVEGRPFPYPKRLLALARHTALGAEICPLLERAAALIVGRAGAELEPDERLDRAFAIVALSSDPDCARLERPCAEAMVAAGVDPAWVEADYDNIDELFLGHLGPMP